MNNKKHTCGAVGVAKELLVKTLVVALAVGAEERTARFF